MTFFRLSDDDRLGSDNSPEIGMNTQFAFDTSHWYVVIGGQGAIRLDDSLGINISDYLDLPFVRPGIDLDTRVQLFQKWLAQPSFSQTFKLTFWAPGGGGSGTISHPPLPPPPTIFFKPYGHCVFSTSSATDAVFYRYEHWPISRRIHRNSSPPTIAQDTFASPASEIQFMQTGFAAVARCALPSLLPAIYRYELQPDANSPFDCGASVPLYGQSGGGVEVKFTNKPGTNNRCPIAAPVYISPL